MQWVIKVSKLCNLRCSYCYEYESLADPARIKVSELISLFQMIALQSGDQDKYEFIWHGGEPLILGSAFFTEIAQIQNRVFTSKKIRYSNHIQTNLYNLSHDALKIIKNREFFPAIGISLDPVTSNRVDVNKKITTQRVLQNIKYLDEHEITYSFITVLSKDTLERVEELYIFFKTLKRSVRILPVYKKSNDAQIELYGVSTQEVFEGFAKVLMLWIGDGMPVKIEPLDSILAIFARHKAGVCETRYPNKSRKRGVLVDTNGSMYRFSDGYDSSKMIGHLSEIELQLENIEVDEEGVGRVASFCTDCEFLGPCDGMFMVEASEVQLSKASATDHPCVARKLLGLMQEMTDFRG